MLSDVCRFICVFLCNPLPMVRYVLGEGRHCRTAKPSSELVKEMRKLGKICLSPFNFVWDPASFFLQKKWSSGLTAQRARWSPKRGSSPRRVQMWGMFWDGVPGLPVAIHLGNLVG